MAWKYRNVLCILLLHMTSSLETEPESEQNWTRARTLVGSPKIVNINGRPTATRRKGTGDSDIVFPGLSSRLGEEIEVQLPPSCRANGICDDAPDYPEDLVKSLLDDFLKQNGSEVFNNDVLLLKLAERIGDENDIELCKSEEMLYRPKLAKSASDEWHYIVNPTSAPQQSFRIVRCRENAANPCTDYNFLAFQSGYSGACEQQYALREMVAVDMKNNRLFTQHFQVPSCCSCLAKIN